MQRIMTLSGVYRYMLFACLVLLSELSTRSVIAQLDSVNSTAGPGYAATYGSKIIQQFGHSAQDRHALSEHELVDVVKSILSGHTYTPPSEYCEGASCKHQCTKLVNEALQNQSIATEEQFKDLCPRLVYYMTQDCVKGKTITKESSEHDIQRPSAMSVWGYGFLFVTLINLCSLAGIFVLPLMKKEFYSTLLMFLIALAVGSLSANGILVLIPEAFEIVDVDGYIWKACTIVGGVYMFFITERILKILTEHHAQKRAEKATNSAHQTGSIPISTYVDVDRCEQNPHPDNDGSQASNDQTSDEVSLQNIDPNNSINVTSTEVLDKQLTMPLPANGKQIHGHSHHHGDKPIATVAWMIIFGDAFHNFIDGLSIGAAFSDSIMLGVSICIAVLCEELPHELGDFAILLNAGMGKKKALLFNFLSACTCYIGLAIGISLSEVAHATPWILGAAGGMFLYISLADMMPEMNHSAEEHKDKPFKVFIIQNLGLLTGFTVIFLVSHFGGMINLSSSSGNL